MKNYKYSRNISTSGGARKSSPEKSPAPDSKKTVALIVVCFALVVVIIALAIMLVQQTNSNESESNVSAGDGVISIAEGSNYLPDDSVGFWELVESNQVLQSPRTTDTTQEEAIAAEIESGVTLAYDCYISNRVSEIISPYYVVTENCGWSELDSEGMQSDGIMETFGEDASIVKIQVYDETGENLADTIFIINETDMIYYGTGNFVFHAQKVEALG